ncbi:MAG: HNH endonuclease [Nostoc sp. LPT]|nr:HNH endonuclease [Nostoc sp. LPT]
MEVKFFSQFQFSIDHILPRSVNGSEELDNLALACQPCNGC